MKFNFLTAGLILFIGLILFACVASVIQTTEMENKCHDRGGVLLDHTEMSGKLTRHSYTCIDPKVIINLD